MSSRSIIQVLDPAQAAHIAAGEVIERPSHILKELIENSIDAGATTISIYLEQAGKQLIRIVDNGCGMWPEDAIKAILPHATSKLRTLEDLTHIQSFGFRGEALYSIAAVSKLKITTRHQDADELSPGITLDYEGLTLLNQQVTAGQHGTDIAVRDLFFSIPVRKKFLKTDQTELNALQAIVHAHALAHHTIWFKLYHQNSLVLNAPPVDSLVQRISQLWGHHLAQNLLPLEGSSEGLSVRGMISNTQLWRYGKQQLFFFVNNRWLKNQELSKGLLKGYERLLPPDKFPAAFLFVTIDPEQIDINVHPKKEEVRFLKPLVLQNFIAQTVKQTLEASVAPTSSVLPINQGLSEVEPWQQEKVLEYPVLRQAETAFAPARPVEQNFGILEELFGLQPALDMPTAHQPATVVQEHIAPRSLPTPEKTPATLPYLIIGQLYATYIVIQQEDALVFIDQHAAHERILYEQYAQNRFMTMPCVQLMFPIVLELGQHECQLVTQHADLLAQMGIEIRQLGPTQLAIHTAPPCLQRTAVQEVVVSTATLLAQEETVSAETLREKLWEHVHSHTACKAAIKAGDVLTKEHMTQLYQDLLKTPNRHMCIHGRPTTWKLDKAEFAKKFSRRAANPAA